ncbi:uncharacterized protein [Cherax quadricarinatus]|uniref:uncharacterized protein n=1 Tax=Cherax quadricarinatus TaxID=27406 RepID=UPI00387E868F
MMIVSVDACTISHTSPCSDGRVMVLPSFTILDATFMVVSMVTFMVDVATDINLVVRYFLAGSILWAGLTLVLVLLPAVIVMVLSMRWHIVDEHPTTKCYWVAHVCLWGIMHRYVIMFETGLKARRTQEMAVFDDLFRQQSDVCMLRMFESFMESAPQLVLQLYIMMCYSDYSVWTALTAFTSMLSLGWSIAAYTKAMRNTRLDKHKMSISGLVLQTVWRVGMIAARVGALALLATVLDGWFLLIMGFHVAAMFVWVVSQKTGFSLTKWEECVFNFIMAVTYCFCFFNLREGPSRWRMLTFYMVVVAENIVFVLIYYLLTHHKPWVRYTALALVFGGLTLGLSCMVLYYRFFHPMGPLKLFQEECKEEKDTEKGKLSPAEWAGPTPPSCNAITRNNTNRLSNRRDFKYMYPVVPKSPNSVLSAPGVSLESSPASCDSTPVSTLPYLQDQKPLGIMCSVQDLLANVSCSSDIEIDTLPQEENSEDNVLSDRFNRSDIGDGPEEQQKLSPSSFERSVNRELNFRLSSSEFEGVDQVDQIKESSQERSSDKRESIQCCTQMVPSAQYYSQIGIPNMCQYQITRNGMINKQEEDRILDNISHSLSSQNNMFSKVYHSLTRYSSPNNVGLPHKSVSTSQTSLNRLRRTDSYYKSILRNSVRQEDQIISDTDIRLTSLPCITSTINVTSESQDANRNGSEDLSLAKPHLPNVELAVIDRMHIIEIDSPEKSSRCQTNYKNIYGGKDNLDRNLATKPFNFIIQNFNETQTTLSSVPHDYENICAININREMWGVRHWKTYSDIEDRIHDNSTTKERLKVLDSTLSSSFHSEHSILKGIQSRRSLSMIDDCESVLSRSLPDLSTLKLETCLEEPEEEEDAVISLPVKVKDNKRLMDTLDQLRAARPVNKSNSVNDIPNYETIWIGGVEKPASDNFSSTITSSNSRSSLVVTIGDVHAKESLCNLYYSTMSDLSFRYYSERMRKNNSVGSLASRRSTRDISREMMRAISVPDNKMLLEVSELIEERKEMEKEKQMSDRSEAFSSLVVNQRDPGTTPVASGEFNRPRRKFSVLRERFEHPNQVPSKSPLKHRQSAQRRNSLQDRTAKALQAGMKVFRRPRVHVITPKKDDNKDTPRLKSPFKSKSVTPSTPAIKISLETPTEFKPKSTAESEITKSVQRTPHVKTPTDHKIAKGTPKTSTPDNLTQALARKVTVAVDPKKVTKITEGPKTSTPEGNKQLPQISILSAVSSVVPSPENPHSRIPLSENLRQNVVSSKSSTMQVIQEMGCTQKVIHQAASYSSVLPGKTVLNLKNSRTSVSDENNLEILYKNPSISGMQQSQSLVNLKAVQTSPRDDPRFSGGQIMFSGALGLPQYHPDPRPSIINISEATECPQNQQNISISHVILSSQSPKFNMQKSTLSPNSKIFSRRI